MRVLAILCLLAFPASAETVRFSQSQITMQETAEPGAVAEIHFKNSNGDQHKSGGFDLTFAEVGCSISITVGLREPDTIEVECPEHIPVPRALTIPDGTDGYVIVYPLGGLSM